MTDDSYQVGYGRPPVHSRFQKGRSGNPGGKRRPQIPLRETFEVVLTECLNASEGVLRNLKAENAIEALACQLVLQAVEGRISAQKLVLALLEKSACRNSDHRETRTPRDAVSAAEEFRALGGENYDEFNARFEKAVASGSVEQLLALAAGTQNANEFPEAGNF
jgi:hypothetical protein